MGGIYSQWDQVAGWKLTVRGPARGDAYRSRELPPARKVTVEPVVIVQSTVNAPPLSVASSNASRPPLHALTRRPAAPR